MKTNDKLNKLSALRKMADTEISAQKAEISGSAESKITEKSLTERTSITLRALDVEAIRKIAVFFMEESPKRVASSAIIQIALRVASKNLELLRKDFFETKRAVQESDMRKTK